MFMDKQTQKNLLKIVRRNYEEIANDFNETRKKYLWPELIKLTNDVKDGDKVLDVGCGNGRLLEAFKNKRIYYLGIDDNEKLLDFAKSRHPNFRFTKGNILELSKISDIDYDYVFCIATLHHLPGNDLRIMALKQMKNKVKTDGKIVLTVWNLWSQKKFRKLIWKFALLKIIRKNKMDFNDMVFKGFKQKSERYYHAFTKRQLKEIAKKAGLKVERIYKDKFNYYAIISHKSTNLFTNLQILV